MFQTETEKAIDEPSDPKYLWNMAGHAATMDSLFLPLKELVRQQSIPFRESWCDFLGKLNELLRSRKNLPEQAALLREEQFSLRLKAIAWLIREGTALDEYYTSCENEWREKEIDHPILVANMRFALHAQVEVMQAMVGPKLDLSDQDPSAFDDLENMSFSNFESALLIGVPNHNAYLVLLGLLHASMDLELALLMGDAVVHDEVHISPKRTDALNRFLVNAAQTYAASSRLIGLVRPVNRPATVAAEPIPAYWVKAQQHLADQGLGDWLKL